MPRRTVTIYHNTDETRRATVAIAEELGTDVEIVNYRSTHPPPTSCGRSSPSSTTRPPPRARGALFEKLGLTDADVATVDQIVDVIVNNKMIMQRPLLVSEDKAIIGRPKERVREFLSR